MASTPVHHGALGPNPATREAQELRETGARPLYPGLPAPQPNQPSPGQRSGVPTSDASPTAQATPSAAVDANSTPSGAPRQPAPDERSREGGFVQVVGLQRPAGVNAAHATSDAAAHAKGTAARGAAAAADGAKPGAASVEQGVKQASGSASASLTERSGALAAAARDRVAAVASATAEAGRQVGAGWRWWEERRACPHAAMAQLSIWVEVLLLWATLLSPHQTPISGH